MPSPQGNTGGLSPSPRQLWERLSGMLLLLLVATSSLHAAPPANTFPLAGEWRFQLDHADVGIQERWFDLALQQKITLPGSLPAQGIGDDVTVDTKWTGSIVDRSWFTAPQYAKYREPGNV
ncbi:MAG: hypothetical protein L0Z07_02405, partial [Planctomycetes bacterium]|nr:hypothetical protein [Planctomycetota bacterium]